MFDPREHWLKPDWSAPAGVHAIVTTRAGGEAAARSPFGFNVGTRCGDDPVAVARNRAFLIDALALPADPCWLHQLHATEVFECGDLAGAGADGAGTPPAEVPHPAAVGEGSTDTAPTGEVDPADARDEPRADAAVARAAGVVLAIQTADCLPVLFCADDGSEIAAAHAGWRGLAAGVVEATLATMRTRRRHVIAWLGPAIGATSYEVGDEVRDAFIARDPIATTAFSATRPGHWMCDLYALARQRLHAAGVVHVSGGDFDTFTDPRLHSCRRDGARSGRMASLLWLR